jgi:pyrroloquinoline quinone (PQQ) biosynthesis protein C
VNDSFWPAVEARCALWDVTSHPFLLRWQVGLLTQEDLATYASEYEHAVTAIALASKRLARQDPGAFGTHAAEEERHVSAWRAFAKASGWGGMHAWHYAEDPLRSTLSCAAGWAGGEDRDLALGLITMYAVESLQARVSGLMLEGLVRYYGYEEGPATEYFRLHSELDLAHARLMREQLDPLLPDVDPRTLIEQAGHVNHDYWRALNGIEMAGRNQCLSC